MLVFPQLKSGACAQYPLQRTRFRRTVRNTMADGSDVRYADAGAGNVRWELPLRALDAAEAGAIEDLFHAAEGRLRPFLLLDPAANLLSWSEDLSKQVWRMDPMIQRTGSVADPQGTARATRLVNAGQAEQELRQTLAVPAWFQYCFSVYARSAAGSQVMLRRSCAGRSMVVTAVLGDAWKRIICAGSLAGNDTGVTFSLALPPGAAVEVFGAQVEAQVAPSAYIITRSRGGVYPSARFDHDELSVTAQGPGSEDTIVRIVSADRV